MTLYADVLFAINFSMDFLSLFITEMILHKKIHKKRILISGVIGGLYGVFEIIFSVGFMLGAIINVGVSLLMCYVAFKENKIGKFTGMLIMFWGVSASLGGIMSLLYTFLNNMLLEYIKNYSYTTVYNGARFFVVASLTVVVSMTFTRIFNSKKSIKEVTINVNINGIDFSLRGICDSGNLLTEPITGKSVILVGNGTKLGKEIENKPDHQKRYIPYHGVENKGVLKGIVPKKILINNREMSAIIAPIKNRDFAGYDALVPISLV